MTMVAVNAELAPWIKMTAPDAWRARTLEAWPTGEPAFRSVVLAMGVIPVDVHTITFASVTVDEGFREQSHSWMNKVWQHERTTECIGDGCTVTDIVSFEARVPGLEALLLPIYRALFAHRHRNLLAIHGPG
jgi:hypothetical protein